MKELHFTKMHGLGNDFVIIDGIGERVSTRSWDKRAVELCDRPTGVGADGVILALKSRKADFRMRMFNPDGSEAEMCGNGLRCMIRLMFDRGYLKARHCRIETVGGLIDGQVVSKKKSDFQVRFAVGEPDFRSANVPVKVKQEFFINGKIKLGRKNYVVTSLSVGNPHTVMFVDDLDFDWHEIGESLERHSMFPRRTNVEFVKVMTRGIARIKSWERGAGPTHASGTGACAVAAAGVMVGLLKREVEAVYDYGSLLIEWNSDDNKIYQTGPAEYCFEGVA